MVKNLELYKSFYYVAKSGSLSRAAELLYISQPALSRAIKQLEEELGCQLFLRTSKGMQLTKEGQTFFHHIEQAFIFIEIGEGKLDAMQNLESGEVGIGVSDTLCKYYLLPYLQLFNLYYPGIKIQVICSETPGIIKRIKDGSVDFGILNMPVQDEQLAFKHIMDIQDCFVCGEKYKHLAGKAQHIREIAKYPLLLLGQSSNTRRYIDRYLEQNNVRVTPAFELGNIDLLIHFAHHDFGIACVIRNFAREAINAGQLYEIKPVEKIAPRSVSAAWPADVPLSAAARKLVLSLNSPELAEI
jgi:Transcriptional regulator